MEFQRRKQFGYAISCPLKDNNNPKTEESFICNNTCDDCSMKLIINCSRSFEFTNGKIFNFSGVNFYNQNLFSIEKMLNYLMNDRTLTLFKLYIYNSSINDETNIKKYVNLKILHLENNLWFNNVSENIFSKFNYLIYLNLNKNSIVKIHENAFEKLTFLEFLDLSTNNFAYMNENHFINLKNLKTLILENLSFKYIDKNSFAYLKNLKILLMKNTKFLKLSEINTNLFKNTKNLENIVNNYLGICCLAKKYNHLSKCIPEETIYLFCGYLISSKILKSNFFF